MDDEMNDFFLLPAFYVTDRGLGCCVDRYRYTVCISMVVDILLFLP